jgi:hypothetical protein
MRSGSASLSYGDWTTRDKVIVYPPPIVPWPQMTVGFRFAFEAARSAEATRCALGDDSCAS